VWDKKEENWRERRKGGDGINSANIKWEGKFFL
jgi:hypothetical protein